MMKKITLLFTLAGCLSLQAFSQSGNTPTSNRDGANAVQSTGSAKSFMNPQPGYLVNHASVQKDGVPPSVTVVYTDDFSLPNDTDGLKARGYLPYYRGTGPMGLTPAWMQGNTANWGDYNTGISDEYTFSNYNSVTGTNDIDNWLVLPALNITSGDVLSFWSRSFTGSTYPDSIRVMYSAVGDSTPEATTWVQLGNFKANIGGSWLQDQFIAPASGATARFAIRYAVVDGGPNGANSNGIGIDQIDVFTPASFDVQALAALPLSAEYTMIPLSQIAGTTINASVKNNGLNATSGGTALIEVIDTVSLAVVFSETVNLPNINPGATAAINTTGTFTPVAAGFLRSKVTVSYPGDGNSSNDVIQSAPTAVTDSIFARDNNISTGSLGIGAGPADGIIGQNFTVTNATDLTSVSFFLTDGFDPNPAGSPVYATIHAQPVGTNPDNTVLATTTTLLVTPGLITTGGQWFTLPLSGSSLPLTPGQYYVGVHEVDSLVTLGTTDQIVTPGTVWVTWNTIPSPPAVNGWATADDFSFAITYNLRMNFGVPTGINEVNANSSLISVYPSPATSELNINLDKSINNAQISIYNSLGMVVKTLNNINGNTTVNVNSFAKGIYTLKVSSNSKEYTQRFTVIK